MREDRLKSVENLKALISETGIPLRIVADVIGCSVRQISRWLAGEAVPSAVYARLIDKAVKRLQARRTKA